MRAASARTHAIGWPAKFTLPSLRSAAHLRTHFTEALELFLAQHRANLREGPRPHERTFDFDFSQLQRFLPHQIFVQLLAEQRLIQFAAELHKLLVQLTGLVPLGKHLLAKLRPLLLRENGFKLHSTAAARLEAARLTLALLEARTTRSQALALPLASGSRTAGRRHFALGGRDENGIDEARGEHREVDDAMERFHGG